MADILKIKVNDEWQSVIAIKGDVGPQGIQREQGIQGIQGIQREQGPVGPKGDAYIITSQDKQEIADIVLAELVDGEEM